MRIEMPVSIIAGDEDRLIDIDEQSGRLHADVPQSALHRIFGAGHMVHQTATEDVMLAIDEAARLGKVRAPGVEKGVKGELIPRRSSAPMG